MCCSIKIVDTKIVLVGFAIITCVCGRTFITSQEALTVLREDLNRGTTTEAIPEAITAVSTDVKIIILYNY